MEIAFDISQTGSGKAGCGYFAHAMVRFLLEMKAEHQYLLLPSFGDFYVDPEMPTSNPYAGRDVRYGPRHRTREKAAEFWSSNDVEVALGNPDLIHSNNFWCPANLRSSRLIYTFYDMGFVINPDWTTEANRVGCFEGVFRSSLYADWIVAISAASREHYLSVFPHFPPERIRVIYPCSRFEDGTRTGVMPKTLAPVQPERFWLTVGTIEPRKNQHRIADAYARYRALGGDPMPLVFAGGRGWLMEDFEEHIKELGIAADVVMAGYVSDDELIWLYRHCYANLYPSLFEGFGLPVLEGMQFGAATVASSAGSIKEVAADSACVVDPLCTEGWASAMLDLANNRAERDRLGAAAKLRAACFGWQKSAHLLLDLYGEAIATPKKGCATAANTGWSQSQQ